MIKNTNKYSYSYANAIGIQLRQPLFKVVSNASFALTGNPLDNQIQRIRKIVIQCFLAALLIIPAGLAWLAGKAISHFSQTRIDLQGLSLAPPQIELPEEGEGDIRILAQKYKALNIPNDRGPGQTSKQDLFERMCEWTATEDQSIYPDNPEKRSLFCKQLSIFLKGIVTKIESGDVAADKQRDLLMELAEASTRCYPTWLEVSAKIYAELHGQAETVEVKLLRLIQDYKESIILEFCQTEADVQWHTLNFVRNILGRELGLNTMLNAHDPYAGNQDAVFGKSLTKWLFLQRYENVNRLVSGIQSTINAQPYDVSYYDHLVKIVTDEGIENPGEYVADQLYTEDYKLNAKGAFLLLKAIHVVK